MDRSLSPWWGGGSSLVCASVPSGDSEPGTVIEEATQSLLEAGRNTCRSDQSARSRVSGGHPRKWERFPLVV